MDIINKIKNKISPPRNRMPELALPADEAQRLLSESKTDLEKLFYSRFGKGGRLVHKWTHFLPIYDRWFSRYRGRPVKILELGVSLGGSLDLWRDYFGQDATIYGVDINPDCAERVTPPNQVRIGSQDDPNFLVGVVSEMGVPDIIIDDGSHIGRHIIASFETLFPTLAEDGLYVIEDMHTSYWAGQEGGYQLKGTGIEYIKQMIDDIHHHYHDEGTTTGISTLVGAIHMYDSLAVVEKTVPFTPRHIRVE